MLEKLEINNTCISCDTCRILCPEKSIYTNGTDYAIDADRCIHCGICMQICPTNSIKAKPYKSE